MSTHLILRRAARHPVRAPGPRRPQPAPTDQRLALQTVLGQPVQAKLRIGRPDDPQEREADTVADRVTAQPDMMLQRRCTQCDQQPSPVPSEPDEDKDKDKEQSLQRKGLTQSPATLSPASSDAQEAIVASKGRGRPLSATEKRFYEPRLNASLAGVRLHVDAQAAHLADRLAARAFTVGSDIYFATGAYQPRSREGCHLLAHELAHVLQQGGSGTLRREPATTPVAREEAPKAAEVPAAQTDADATAQEDLPADFCQPYRWAWQASAAHVALNASWLPYARGMFGATVADLWRDYLGRAKGSSLSPRVFNEPGDIATAFRDAWASTADRDALFNELAVAMRGRPEVNAPLPARPGGYTAQDPYRTPAVSITSLLPPASLTRNIDYDWGAFSVPGNLAGGIGSSDAGPDTRFITGGEAWVARYQYQGHEMKVMFIDGARYQVNDAVDFCPGNPGGLLAQRFTIPMSRLEATPWTTTYDLPFQVNFRYDGARTL